MPTKITKTWLKTHKWFLRTSDNGVSHGGFKRAHFRFTGAHVTQIMLGVVTLYVNDDTVGQLEAIAVVGGNQRLLFIAATGNHGRNLGVLSFYG